MNDIDQACFYIEKMASAAVNTGSPKLAISVLKLRGKLQEDASAVLQLDEMLNHHGILKA